MPQLDPHTVKTLRERLDAREAELGREVREVGAERDDMPSKLPRHQAEDEGEQSEQRFRESVRHAERERDMLELREIAAARERMAAGDYGRCIDCEADIPLARLQAQPWASRCIACQALHEQRFPPQMRVSQTSERRLS
jgi:DnaK suppressor protein